MFSISGPNGTNFGPVDVQQPAMESDLGSDTKDLDRYKPYYFQTSYNDLFPAAKFSDGLTYKVVIEATSSVTGNKNSTITLNVPVFSTELSSGYSQGNCSNNGGEYTGGRCKFYSQLAGYCMKISNAGDKWVVDEAFGGSGCTYGWDPVSTKSLSYNNGGVYTTPIPFYNVQFGIRSQADPRIEAEYLTNGSLDFGLTKAEIAATGLIIMIIGIIFMIPCCCMTILLIYTMQRRRR